MELEIENEREIKVRETFFISNIQMPSFDERKKKFPLIYHVKVKK